MWMSPRAVLRVLTVPFFTTVQTSTSSWENIGCGMATSPLRRGKSGQLGTRFPTGRRHRRRKRAAGKGVGLGRNIYLVLAGKADRPAKKNFTPRRNFAVTMGATV